MTREEYTDLFHKARVNLVAFKPVFHCDLELMRMVELAVEAEREACAVVCEAQEDDGGEWDIQQQCANAIRARNNL